MKKTIILSLALLTIILTGCYKNDVTPETSRVEMYSDFQVKYFGKIPENRIHRYDIMLFNTYDEIVHITEAKSTCPCLTAKINDDLIRNVSKKMNNEFNPNQRKIMEVNYNPKLRPNQDEINIEEMIMLKTDNKENPLITITFKGEID